MYVHSRYKKAKKFALGGAVILGQGENAILRPPPGEPPPIAMPDDVQEDSAPAAQVAAAIARARNPRSEMPQPEVRYDGLSEKRGIYSAPNCRETTSWTGRREDRPGSITLTPAMKEAAKIAGITETAYAVQLLRLRQEKIDDPAKYGGGQ